jgi:hypothetical protein
MQPNLRRRRPGLNSVFRDFDYGGEDMVRSLQERLGFFGCVSDGVKCALVADHVEGYQLPPDFTETTDTRRAAFVAIHGDVAAALDGLPVDVLTDQLRDRGRGADGPP